MATAKVTLPFLGLCAGERARRSTDACSFSHDPQGVLAFVSIRELRPRRGWGWYWTGARPRALMHERLLDFIRSKTGSDGNLEQETIRPEVTRPAQWSHLEPPGNRARVSSPHAYHFLSITSLPEPDLYRVKINSDIQRHWQPTLALQRTVRNYYWTPIGPRFRPLGHATLRAFVAVFRAMRGFLRDATAVFLALGAALTEDGNSILSCFAVRWWPWFSGWMRAASSSARS
jgi:hypothetical protein